MNGSKVSYLSGRSQCVVLDGVSSLPTKVSSGVPQGSILGPLLFLIYIDHLCYLQLSNSTTIQLYADDILLFAGFKCANDLVLFQKDINTVASAVHNLGLRLNASKTKLLVISRKHTPPSITLNVANSLTASIRTLECRYHLTSLGDLILMPSAPKPRSNWEFYIDIFIQPVQGHCYNSTNHDS